MTTDNDEYIETGDLVELVVQPLIYGMAIGFEGSLIHVRLTDGRRVAFHEYELRKMAGVVGDATVGEVPTADIIDFTKARDLRTAKTRGVA